MNYVRPSTLFTEVKLSPGQYSEFPLFFDFSWVSISEMRLAAKAGPARSFVLAHEGGPDYLDVRPFDVASWAETQQGAIDAFGAKLDELAGTLLVAAGRGNCEVQSPTLDGLKSAMSARWVAAAEVAYFEHDGWLVGVDTSIPDRLVMTVRQEVACHKDPQGGYYVYGEFGFGVLDNGHVVAGRVSCAQESGRVTESTAV